MWQVLAQTLPSRRLTIGSRVQVLDTEHKTGYRQVSGQTGDFVLQTAAACSA